MAWELLRPLLEKADQRRCPRASAAVAVQRGHQRRGVRHGVALARKTPCLADDPIQVDVACPPQLRSRVTNRLPRSRHSECLARPRPSRLLLWAHETIQPGWR